MWSRDALLQFPLLSKKRFLGEFGDEFGDSAFILGRTFEESNY